jgi:hypothetical protein
VATILILALTVTLFASIFAFVGSFPAPPPQNVSQFQASLVRTSNQSYISSLKIEHLTGPAVPGSDRIYLESATKEPNWQFSISGGIPIYWGLSGNTSTATWSFGQYWSTSFTKLIKVPDNITVYVLTPNQLLYSAVLPGLVINTPPAILASGVTPTPVATGATFTVWASLGGTLTGLVAKVNLASIPGLSGNQTLTLQSSGLYSYTTSGGSTTAGTWYAVIYITNTLGQVASTSVPVVVSSSGGGGGSSQLTVAVGMSPQPPTLPQQATTPYYWATITYTGSKTASVYVNFTVSQIAGGRKTPLTVTNTVLGTGATPVSITGPSSLTVYSQSASGFDNWIMNATVTISAPTTVLGVGTATGATEFTTANLVHANIYVTTSSTGATSGTEHSGVSHSCSAVTSCPYLYVEAWDNYSVALGGPATVTFAGLAWVNASGHTYEVPGAGIASTTLTALTPLMVNLEGGTTRWGPISAGTYIIHLWLQIKTTASGTPIIEYVHDAFSLTVS